MFRSGTIPMRLRTDRGVEFKNALLQEYTALTSVGHRFGTAWRPMEQGVVENKHKETQKIMSMLVNDILRCFPNEAGELLHVVEFVVYNTPGPHGYTPRDIDRQWSLSCPLDREMAPCDVSRFEPGTDRARTMFHQQQILQATCNGHGTSV